MSAHDLWRIEEKLWLGGREEYAAVLHPNCLMVFAQMGVLDASSIFESLGGQRWRSVALNDRALRETGPDVAVLAYRAEAQRDGSDPYRCVCSSTYVREGDCWRIVQHQQSAE